MPNALTPIITLATISHLNAGFAMVNSLWRFWDSEVITGIVDSALPAELPRPHYGRLAVESIVTRAADDGSECICVLIEWEIGKFELLSQKPSTHS